MTTVCAHIGLAKTGTTSLQYALQEHVSLLAGHGVLFPGGTHARQTAAVYDLMGRKLRGEDLPNVPGAFGRLVTEIDAWTGRQSVLSQEILALARPKQVRHCVEALRAHRVVVVVTVRDLARTICSAWQQEIFQGQTYTWAEYLSAIRGARDGTASAGLSFWARQDLLRVLNRWEAWVPRENIRVVTLPPAGQPPHLLFDRFAEVLGLPLGTLYPKRHGRNPSLGAAELEALRRMNAVAAVDGRPQRHQLLRPGIRERLSGGDSRPLMLPAEELTWVTEHAERLVDQLKEREYFVVGDLDELLPTKQSADSRRPDDVTEPELLSATTHMLQVIVQEYGAVWRDYQRLQRQISGDQDSGLSNQLAHSSRSLGFRLRQTTLNRAEHNRLVGWAAHAYQRRKYPQS
jgi:hypothetical protein